MRFIDLSEEKFGRLTVMRRAENSVNNAAQWEEFETFEAWALANGYDPEAEYGKCTIDRINVDGDYEPSNCRWVNMTVQANNKRKAV